MELTKGSKVESYKSEWISGNTCKSKSPVINQKFATLENFDIVSK